jgi:UDP-N-acetylglucosamine 1-carboxyvinyltransferase
LGASCRREGHTLIVDTSAVDRFEAPYALVARMRASIAVLGPLLATLGEAQVAMPGGCNIGSRKIDMHIRGLQELGAEITIGHGFIHARSPEQGLVGSHVMLDFPSVGATENLLMAAVRARGTTVIENAAREPEIRDLVAFMNQMGARVEAQGSTLTIEGADEMHPAEHRVIGDRIEAGTFLVAGAITGGSVTVRGFSPADLEMVLMKLVQSGARVDVGDDSVHVHRDGPIVATDVQTLPHPGFPTDMQPQFMALLSCAEGSSMITENVFENRFMFADELSRMGADIRIEDHHALVQGVRQLSGAPVISPDLRGGAALVLAGLCAEGETVVRDAYHIDRGYERFVEKLASLGASVRRAEEHERI